MKYQASWQTAQRLSSRNRKYMWCHPEAKLRKVFVGNVFWKREFLCKKRPLCKDGCGRLSSAMSYLHMAVAWEKCKNTISIRQYIPRTPSQSPETCDSGDFSDRLLRGSVCVYFQQYESF